MAGRLISNPLNNPSIIIKERKKKWGRKGGREGGRKEGLIHGYTTNKYKTQNSKQAVCPLKGVLNSMKSSASILLLCALFSAVQPSAVHLPWTLEPTSTDSSCRRPWAPLLPAIVAPDFVFFWTLFWHLSNVRCEFVAPGSKTRSSSFLNITVIKDIRPLILDYFIQ